MTIRKTFFTQAKLFFLAPVTDLAGHTMRHVTQKEGVAPAVPPHITKENVPEKAALAAKDGSTRFPRLYRAANVHQCIQLWEVS